MTPSWLGIMAVERRLNAQHHEHVAAVCRPGAGAETCIYLTMDDGWKCARGTGKLAAHIEARTKPRFVEIPRERGGGKVPFTDEQLTALRGGLTAEEYRWKLIRKWSDQA